MREFDIERASLNVRWNYQKLIPALPVTGTEAFSILCDKLAPFGLSDSRIFLEAPSTKLGDAVMTVILLEGRVGIKFWISSFEIIVDELYDDDEQNVVDIANVLFEALKKIDEKAESGTAHVRLRYHLKLSPNENSKIIKEHLSKTNESVQLIPEMAIYQINTEANQDLQNARVALAKSVVYENSIFLDINFDYSKIEDISSFKDIINRDVNNVFVNFGLKDRVID